MNEDYLWDGSGPPDIEVAQLERRLAPLRYRHRAPRPSNARWTLGALAGTLIAVAAGLALIVTPPAQNSAWQVDGASLRQGQTVRTGDTAVRLDSEAVGRVDLAANSVLRTYSGKRLALQRGELHAFIWAPAGEFVVETPSARAVDLGCEYTLNVDPTGDGVLRVALGWVAFQVGDREAFIPAGATCATRKRGGPGIPYFEDAPDALRRGVNRFEHGDPGALPGLLAAARPHDGLTLWHLLTRVPESQRGVVFDRFRDLVQLPAGISRDAILHRDPQAIDQCWNALDLENTSWWRGWKRNW